MARRGESDDPNIRRLVVNALLSRAFLLGGLQKFEEEIANYDTILDYSGQQEKPSDVSNVALAFKCLRLAELGRAEEALAGSAVLAHNFAGIENNWDRALEWIGLAARAVALTVQRHSGSIDAFRAAYARFPAGNEVTTRLMIRLVMNLVAVGAREEQLAEVLADDRRKSRAIAPLVVALRERRGETVRAPAEVREVAADIRKTLDEKSAKGILSAF